MTKTMEDIDFTTLETVRKKCLYFGPGGNQVVKGYKDLYRIEDITGIKANLYIEVSGNVERSFMIYTIYDDLGPICIKNAIIPEYFTPDDLLQKVSGYQFWGKEGLINRLALIEQREAFINIMEIEALRLLEKEDLASHYADYRDCFLEKRHLLEEQQQKEEREKAEEDAEKLRKQIQLEIANVKKAIRKKETVYNRILNLGIPGRQNPTVILYLMKQYGINIPLKTQGWVNKALSRIYFQGEKITYCYYNTSKNSTVFYLYLAALEQKILEEGENVGDCA